MAKHIRIQEAARVDLANGRRPIHLNSLVWRYWRCGHDVVNGEVGGGFIVGGAAVLSPTRWTSSKSAQRHLSASQLGLGPFTQFLAIHEQPVRLSKWNRGQIAESECCYLTDSLAQTQEHDGQDTDREHVEKIVRPGWLSIAVVA